MAPVGNSVYRLLFEAAPDAIVGVDLSGRIVLVNAQAERLFGYERGELVGQSVEVLVPLDVRGVHSSHRREYLKDPKARPMGAGLDLAACRKDGTEFPAEISLNTLEADTGVLVSAAVRDVSERIEAQAERERLKSQADRERLERQHQQSQRLESLGQLAGGVAHDFNNLLAVIVNYAAFVGDEAQRAASEEHDPRWASIARDVEEIKRAGERASHLTRQLLAFARREVVQATDLDLNDVVASVEQLLRRTLGEHIDLQTSLDPELWSVHADPGQLEQVLVNLAVNARDAMPRGGTLSIDTQNAVADDAYVSRYPGLEPGRYVRLRVSDTGTGMDLATLSRAVEPFFTTKPKGEGSGLGLATVYGIVMQARGHVHIYSEPDIGTTITALLPATDAVVTKVEPVTSEEAAPTGGTILVVEDEEAVREVARRILSNRGYDVVTASSGDEALIVVEDDSRPIDLLLTDVIMPRMLGKELAEQAVRIRPGLPVLYMSGYAHPVLASQGTLDEGVALIEKPFSGAELLAKVRDVLEG